MICWETLIWQQRRPSSRTMSPVTLRKTAQERLGDRDKELKASQSDGVIRLRCQTPEDATRGPVIVAWWVRAKSDPRPGLRGSNSMVRVKRRPHESQQIKVSQQDIVLRQDDHSNSLQPSVVFMWGWLGYHDGQVLTRQGHKILNCLHILTQGKHFTPLKEKCWV